MCAKVNTFTCTYCQCVIPVQAEPIIKDTCFGDMPVIHTCAKCGAKYTPYQSGKELRFKLNKQKSKDEKRIKHCGN